MYIINNIKQLYEEAINMNILMIIGIILGGGVSVASTVGITVGIFGTIVYKFYRKLRFGISMFERMNNNMLGNITVGIVIVLAVAACGLGVWLDRAKSDSQDNNTDAQSKN